MSILYQSRSHLEENGALGIPINFVADAVLGEVDVLELACLWSNELGTASLWHQVLNLGIPLAASAGSDVDERLLSNYGHWSDSCIC